MGFFLGNSMPIRDVDAFSGIKEFSEGLNVDRETARRRRTEFPSRRIEARVVLTV